MNQKVSLGSHSVSYSSPVSDKPYGFCGTMEEDILRTEPRSSVRVDVDVLGSPSLIILMVAVDVKLH